MNEPNPMIEDYMNRFDAALQRHALPEWQEISAELRNHIADALGHRKPLDAVLQALGAPDALARAYAVELLVRPTTHRRANGVGRVLSVLGILAAGSVVTLIAFVALGSIGVVFAAGGLLTLVIGCLEAAGVHLSFVSMGGFSPLEVIAMGPVMFAIGWAALWALWRYVRFLSATLRKLLPRPAAAAPN